MLGVGLVELVIAGICVLGKAQGLSIALVAWLATSFVAYRLGLASMGWQKPCSCLGDITEALRISSQTADNIMKFVLAYLLIGSYGVLTRYGWAAGPANCYPVSGNSSEI